MIYDAAVATISFLSLVCLLLLLGSPDLLAAIVAAIVAVFA